MKKMPCLFVRDFSDKRNPKMSRDVTPGCEWVLAGEGVATPKWDGTACLIREGRLFKRYDAKRGKEPPAGFEACDEPDPITGHHPGWVPVNVENPDPADVWHALAWAQACNHPTPDFGFVGEGTFELVGPRINANRHGLLSHRFVRHGLIPSEWKAFGSSLTRSFDDLRAFLETFPFEGIVFWRSEDGNCEKVKIRRDDYGLPWPPSGE